MEMYNKDQIFAGEVVIALTMLKAAELIEDPVHRKAVHDAAERLRAKRTHLLATLDEERSAELFGEDNATAGVMVFDAFMSQLATESIQRLEKVMADIAAEYGEAL